MFNPSREQVRRFFCDAWKKHLERLPLVGAEVTAAGVLSDVLRLAPLGPARENP